MNINDKLVTQVQEGKACIWVTDFKQEGVNNKINSVKRLVYPKSPFTFERRNYYWFRGGAWHFANTPPTGLTPIPLDDFFKGEEEKMEEKLIVGARVKYGVKYAEHCGVDCAGEIITLVQGHFEHDNGLYTEDQTSPAIWDEDASDFESIYHLFGNDFEYFFDCEVLPPHSSTPTPEKEVEGFHSPLSKAAHRYFSLLSHKHYPSGIVDSFIAGAKWQASQSTLPPVKEKESGDVLRLLKLMLEEFEYDNATQYQCDLFWDVKQALAASITK